MRTQGSTEAPRISGEQSLTSSRSKYVVITPVRDEEAHIRLTLESVIAQTIVPTEWIIVDDGSTDKTGNIIDEYADRYPWIHAVHRDNRGFRKSGGGVVEAFDAGYKHLKSADWDFIVKLDGDLSFDSEYFENCFGYFERDPELGIGGGLICHVVDGRREVEACPKFHVRGATKIYRRACWDAIGGFWPAPGWDTMDEVKANRLNWNTLSFSDQYLIHHRLTGSADGLWGGYVKNGRANYICGYHPLFMISKCVRRLIHRPYVVASAALFYGFVSGYVKRIPQSDDRETIRYLRRQQIGRLFGRESIWR